MHPRSRRPRRRPIPPGTIRRGPYAGLSHRPRTDGKRHLTLAQVTDLTNALAFADTKLDRPLSVQITIAWNRMKDFRTGAWSRHQAKLFRSMSRWLQRHGIDPTFVWVREVAVESDGETYCHTHAQLYIPKQRTGHIAGKLVAFLMRRFKFRDEGVAASFGKYGMWTPQMRAGNLAYMLKGIDHAAFRYVSPTETVNIGAALGIRHRGTQGTIAIKRSGTSKNIGEKARRAAGWVERRTLSELHAILHPPKKQKGLLLGRKGAKSIYLNTGAAP